MPQRHAQPHSIPSNEPDLLHLLLALWQGRITILICATLAAVLAAGYLWFDKPRWTASALITLPGDADMAGYTSLTNILTPVIASKVVNNAMDEKKPVSNGDIKEMNFSRAMAMLDAQGPGIVGFKAEAQDKEMPWPVKISVSADDAQSAARELDSVLMATDRQLRQAVKEELNYLIDTRITQLNTFISAQETVAEEKKADRLNNLKQALLVAREANVAQLSVQQVSTLNNDALFVLGSDALSAMIDNERSRPLQLSDSYYQLRQELLELKTFRQQPFQYSAFSYIVKPTVPLQPDDQRSALLIVLALLAGVITGVAITIARKGLQHALSQQTQLA
jgi:chain length determinant protein (polysaccharide antigen chain regulator)